MGGGPAWDDTADVRVHPVPGPKPSLRTPRGRPDPVCQGHDGERPVLECRRRCALRDHGHDPPHEDVRPLHLPSFDPVEEAAQAASNTIFNTKVW